MKGEKRAKDRFLRVSLKWGSDESFEIGSREVIGAPSVGFFFDSARP